MDTQTLINAVLAVVAGGLGWFAREMWSAVKELKNDLAALREQLPKEYVAKSDFREALSEVRESVREGFKEVQSTLGRIFDRLDNKVDK